ncbi:glycosyltransferase family 9 protein [Telmatospirillum sp.]|uniref:glycosyltransferase family 9 protein n=1 Tax=Telmatospirillum sp. TaxID=2079197 RepID=UPI00284FE4DE|nr:glycosyltransferase family 9 protein [Telmatospirillum sp.]MDR3435503.1 glycosyltransferase family 9 protein [Telmatospirillum sp.]
MTTLTPQQAEREARQALAANQFETAEALARALLAGGRGPLQIWALLATALRRQGRIEETRTIQQMLVDAAPQNVELRFDLAETLLLQGEFDRGWREYRFRYSLPHTTRLERHVQTPRWEGEPLPGKTLLIHDEQGYGDTFQFLRMVPWAKKKSGARVVLQISRELYPFARRMKGIDALVVRGEVPPPFDTHCEMMSLPMAMGLKMTDLPGRIPYLSLDQARVRHWRKRLADLPGPRVALVWAGRPNHFNDANRSVRLPDLAGLGMPDVTFLAVQQGPKAVEAASPPAGMRLVDLSGEIRDFDDTAAILSVIDLLISVDSSPVHLAGALGRPAWVMLPFIPDWRWLMKRADTPWYPSLRLFRQPAWGDWPAVVQAMAEELAQLRQASALS